jgi:hypothetical protein
MGKAAGLIETVPETLTLVSSIFKYPIDVYKSTSVKRKRCVPPFQMMWPAAGK